MPITTILFDLDNTLYPHSSGVWDAAVARIELFMRDRVGLPAEQVAALRLDYLARYGTTLRGLYEEHAIDRDKYLDFIHDVDIEGLLPANPALAAMLASMPQRKVIFTNASRAHARRVLGALGVHDAFNDIISLEDLDYVSKPEASVYPLAYRLAGAQSATATLFVDDQARNLEPARALGWGTVLVGGSPNADHPHIERVEDLPLALPSLVK